MCRVFLLAVCLGLFGCMFNNKHAGTQSSGDAGKAEVIETDDMSKVFSTTDADELKVAEASMQDSDDEYADDGSDVYKTWGELQGDVFICVRSVIEKRIDGTEGVKKAASFLGELERKTSIGASISGLLSRCQTYVKSGKTIKIDRNVQALSISHLDSSVKYLAPDNIWRVKVTLYRFAKPTTTCFAIGATADLGLAASVGAGLNLDYCSANNGRRWFQTSLEGRGGYGVGGLALIRFGRYRYRTNYLAGPFVHTKTRSKKWALLFGMQDVEMGEDYQHKMKGIIFVIPSRNSNKNALGLGMGYFKEWGLYGGLKFLPLGTSKKKLVNNFKRLLREDLAREEATISHALDVGDKEKRMILRVTTDDNYEDPSVKFTACSSDGERCADLLGGKYFSVRLMQNNLRRMRGTVDSLSGKERAERIKLIASATLATSIGGIFSLRRVLDSLTTTTEGIKLTEWTGNRPYVADINNRGIKYFDFFKSFKPAQDLQKFLQGLVDSKPVSLVHKMVSNTYEGWNKIFEKAPTKIIGNNFFRLGIPIGAIVVSGVIAVISSVKVAQHEIMVKTYNSVADKQEQIIKLIPNPEREIIIYDKKLMLIALQQLVM